MDDFFCWIIAMFNLMIWQFGQMKKTAFPETNSQST